MFPCFYNAVFSKLFRSSKCSLKLAFRVSYPYFSSKSEATMLRVLNVAEKNDAAKSITELMSNGRYQRREGLSVYNKIYEFEHKLFNQKCWMTVTSVSGHLLNLEFLGAYRKWMGCNPVALFDAPVNLYCQENFLPIKNTLEREIKNCQHLILWTDCDREGENIAFEIIEVCKKIKPNIQVHRAKFSEITQQAITRAMNNLCPPDSRMNDAVNVRRELDLRIGAAFTRFQTLRLSKVFPEVLGNQLISYGSCQFPTLGFVVDRYKQVQAFIPEAFWKLKVLHKKNDIAVEFSWKRGRLFDHTACLVLYQLCLEQPTAEVTDIRSRPKNKWRPQPLDTVELEKTASRKLRIGAKETLTIAEKLYTKGFISYPRTETTIFPKELNLESLVQLQCEDQNWGEFANRVLQQGPNPRQGTKTDNAHPPIHPIKYTNSLQGNEKTIYDYVVRHFLACLSQDAKGKETTVEISVNNEKFAVSGLMIIERNYLDVYPYEKWNAKEIPEYSPQEKFQPDAIEMVGGQTQAPDLLTEADLIALMEKHGIGTDATHAEHIETIKSRLYVGVNDSRRFVPGELGMGLVDGYDLMGYQMSKPHLRAELEADLKRICEGTKDPQVVLREQIAKYKEYFIRAVQQANKIDEALSSYFQLAPGEFHEDRHNPPPVPVMKCPKCRIGDIVIKARKENKGFYLSCMTYPQCNASMWLPECVEQVSTSEEICSECLPGPVKKLKFKVKRNSLRPFYEDEFTKCVGGCDQDFLEVLNVRSISSSVSQNSRNNSLSTTSNSTRNGSRDSGFASGNSNTLARGQSTIQNAFSMNSSRNSLLPAQSRNQNTFTVPSSQSSSGNASRFNAGPTDGEDVLCSCGKSAVRLMVRKEGPNKGKFFYKCSQMNEAQCNFFLWDDQVSSPSNSINSRPAVGSSSNGSGPVCECSIPAKLLTVQKEGPNKGRKFYRCASVENSCRFFKWEEEWNPSSNQQTFPAVAQPGTSQKRSQSSNSSGLQSKRKCGLCNEPGHNRTRCPLNTS